MSATKSYNSLLRRTLGPRRVVGVECNTLIMIQDGLDDIVFIHRDTPAKCSIFDCNKSVEEKHETSTEQELYSEKDSEENLQNSEDMSVVQSIFRIVKSVIQLKHIVRWYSFVK